MRLCEFEGCDKEHVALGMCESHYRITRRRDSGVSERVRGGCWTEDCDDAHHAQGLCKRHYETPARSSWPEYPFTECAITGCTNSPRSRSHLYCHTHKTRMDKYNIDADDFEVIVNGNLTCLLCPNTASVVDHDHIEGHKRGFLCNSCNILLGQIETLGGLDRVHKAISYLEDDAKNPGSNWDTQFGDYRW